MFQVLHAGYWHILLMKINLKNVVCFTVSAADG
jgi:hypothetical protein